MVKRMSEAAETPSGEVGDVLSGTRSSLRGPLILAKLVVDALEKKQQGDASDYHAIAEQLSAPQIKPVVMRRWLQALRLCVSQLTKEYDILVGATLRFKWYDKDPDVVELYIDYLTNLISAQTCYLKSSLQELVKNFWQLAPNQEVVCHNIHEALQAILHIVPTAPSVLMPLLSKSYPFKGKGAEIQELSLRNLLHIMSYCPTLREGILQLTTHQMIAIDVEIPKTEEEGETDGEESEETQFHVELEGATHGCHGNGTTLLATYSQHPMMSNEMTEKLDILMTITLQHLHSMCHHDGKFTLEAAVELFQSLLKIFEQVVLPTHACSHVQFLLFRFTSYHEAFHGHFLDFLWEKFQDFNTPAVIRQSAAAYMASYIARAKFVPLSSAKLCLTIMMQWIHQYIDSCSQEYMKPDVKQHGPFYSLCQAVFYIFIFRHEALLEAGGGISFLRQLNLERVVSSRLNPLKVCLPTVVEMFASLTSCCFSDCKQRKAGGSLGTSHHEIVFCYTILEQNKRIILSSSSVSMTTTLQQSPAAAHTNYLDCFFPFDPYHLKRSSQFISPLYQEWEGVGTTREDEMEDDDRGSVSSSCMSSSYGHSAYVPSSVDSHLSPRFSVSPQ